MPVIEIVIGAAFSILVQFIKSNKKRNFIRNDNDIVYKIKSVSDELTQSAVDISEIQEELKERIILINRLREEAARAEQIISLSKDQVDAVNSILKREGNKGFWLGVGVNFIFFIMGAVLSYTISI